MLVETAVGDGLEVGIFGERRAETAPDLMRDRGYFLAAGVRQRDRQIVPQAPVPPEPRPERPISRAPNAAARSGLMVAQQPQKVASARP